MKQIINIKKNWFIKIGTIALLLGVLIYACKTTEEGIGAKKPEENRFTTANLNQPGSLDEPMAFTFLNSEELVVVERKGAVKAFNIASKEMKQIGHVPVNTMYTNAEGKTRAAEEGLMGVIAHPNYAENN